MNRISQVNICKHCIQRKFDVDLGLICGLTNKLQDFEQTCQDFEYDTKSKSIVDKYIERFDDGVGTTKGFITMNNIRLQFSDYKNQNSKDSQIRKNEITHQMTYVKTRIRAVRKYRRVIQYVGYAFLLISFFLLIPFLSISDTSPDLGAVMLFEFQPKFTFKILFFGIVLTLIGHFTNIINTKKTKGTIELNHLGFVIKLKKRNIELFFNMISYVNISIVYSSLDNDGVTTYRVDFHTIDSPNKENRIHFKNNNLAGEILVDFFKTTDIIKVKQN